tara:strand:+ start:48 stop:452 length:405 start_codon:yes stop_codon:yes gene_type:complete
MKLRYYSFQLQLKQKEIHIMIEFCLAYLTRLSSGQLVYSTRRVVQSTGLFVGMNITMYKPGGQAEDSATLWMDETIYKEASLRTEHPTCYIEVDKSGVEWVSTGATLSIQDYEASLKSVPTSKDSEPVQESATI